MGLRFDLQWANWVAYLTVPGRPPPAPSIGDERSAIEGLLSQLEDGFLSSSRSERYWRDYVQYWRANVSHYLPMDHHLSELRAFLQHRPWTALIVPSGSDSGLDGFICSREFLREAVSVRPDDPGLVLQIKDPPESGLSLENTFPAFRTALANSGLWPGLLIWTIETESIFLPFDESERTSIRENTRWIFSHLATSIGVDLEEMHVQYEREFPNARERRRKSVHLIHLSDVHLGCKEAQDRLPRVQQLIRNTVNELGESQNVLPILSGDIVESPDRRFLGEARAFVDFLCNLGTLPPVVVLGNHDVRRGGILGENFKSAFRMPTTQVVWFDDQQIGLIPFNSVMDGSLARGSIGEPQLVGIGNELDRRPESNDFALFAVLHHHPIPVEAPDWYARNFFERWFGRLDEKTMELEDASSFIEWIERRRVTAVLHGHKHIPRIAETPTLRIPVYGCGSTVGKVKTTDRRPYISLNVITYEPKTRRLVGRLLAERIPGAGLDETKRHELITFGRRPL